ncbi:Proteasome lid subunit RPN8/RPN11, contains Jab1/MPN metalloenzyme (JAMM) motif [Sphingomonas sp. OV641]|uniref:Mov34/MPN/PAD-1 family protein n=1 Tax=Sphingomonas sp. OV641 TaxID=1881068 RepID=UPI0008D704D7|nr:Proteasome lid subunit RPN8/RPN11, contains Jab1/MPN metalloenzyme (JAMM) motif [Sphingomonas sp. OV641]
MDMTLRISRSLAARIIAETMRFPVETCGLLLGNDNDVDAIEPCANVHPTPATHFEIDPAALFRALRRARAGGPQVIGHYHSHPSGIAAPSATDAVQAAADGAFWLIVAGSDLTAWRASSDGAVHGRFDPVALAIAP